MNKWLLLPLLFVVLLSVLGCSASPPKQPNHICAILKEKKSWKRALKKVERRWHVSPAIIMSFMFQESSFRSDVRPERLKLLGIVPWVRPSSAYGYAQATNEAWSDYRSEVFNPLASRSNFHDAADFIGWYNERSSRHLSISKKDPYRLYLAYHEGVGGYRSKKWVRKTKLKKIARKVSARSSLYSKQMRGCW